VASNGAGGLEEASETSKKFIALYQKNVQEIARLCARLVQLIPTGFHCEFRIDLSGDVPKLVTANGEALGRDNVEIITIGRPAASIQQGFRVDLEALK